MGEAMKAKLKFNLDAGILIRGSIRTLLKLIERDFDVEVDSIEDKGLINSIFYVKVTGDEREVIRVWGYINTVKDSF